MNKSKAIRILEEDTYYLSTNKVVHIPTITGTIDKDLLVREKKKLIRDSASIYGEHLISTKNKKYPVDGFIELELESDLIIMRRDAFDKLKKYVDNE